MEVVCCGTDGLAVGTGVVTVWVDGVVHPLIQSINIRAPARSPNKNDLIDLNLKFCYKILWILGNQLAENQ
jgi:hypothetical protein